MAAPRLDPEETLRLIEQYDRTPFQEALAGHVRVQPAPEALQVFANKYPDRHAQAITMYARLSGYSEAPTVNVNVYARVQSMGQVELAKALRETLLRLREIEAQALAAPNQSNQLVSDVDSP